MNLPSDSELSLEPIEQSTRTELVANRLLSLLSSGSLKPGDKLPPERDLARRLNVGRTTVREALKLLTLSGLLEARRGDGTYVKNEFTSLLSRQIEWPLLLNTHELEMIVEVREALDVKAARLAAERASPDELERIAVYQQLGTLPGRDFQRETELDLAFHDAISAAAHNPLLASVMLSLRDFLSKYILLSNEMTEQLDSTIAEHDRVYQAIAARDPDRAELAMKAHLDSSMTHIVRAIRSGRMPPT